MHQKTDAHQDHFFLHFNFVAKESYDNLKVLKKESSTFFTLLYNSQVRGAYQILQFSHAFKIYMQKYSSLPYVVCPYSDQTCIYICNFVNFKDISKFFFDISLKTYVEKNNEKKI